MEVNYNHLKENINLYVALFNTLATGFLTYGTFERLAEGDYKSAAILGALDIGNAVAGIVNYKKARKTVDKK